MWYKLCITIYYIRNYSLISIYLDFNLEDPVSSGYDRINSNDSIVFLSIHACFKSFFYLSFKDKMPLHFRSVLISDPVDQSCAALLQQYNIPVTTKYKLSKEELIKELQVNHYSLIKLLFPNEKWLVFNIDQKLRTYEISDVIENFDQSNFSQRQQQLISHKEKLIFSPQNKETKIFNVPKYKILIIWLPLIKKIRTIFDRTDDQCTTAPKFFFIPQWAFISFFTFVTT